MNHFPLIITSLIAVISTVMPFLTNKSNNKHQLNLKNSDINFEKYKLDVLHQRDIFENYLKVVGLMTHSLSDISTSEMTKAYYELLPYIPRDKASAFSEFSEIISKMDFENKSDDMRAAELLHQVIIPTIKEQLQQLYK